jgi:hypothetical protein
MVIFLSAQATIPRRGRGAAGQLADPERTTGGKAFEVEFMTLDGQTAAVATVEASAVRPVTSREITHSRELSAPA